MLIEDDSRDEDEEEEEEDEGPMIERAVGRSTKPWKRPKMTVRKNT